MKKSAGKNKTDEVFIPDKLYFRIGEVATLCRLPAYVLRFWESEFPQLKPVKSSTGQRMYRRRDVESTVAAIPAIPPLRKERRSTPGSLLMEEGRLRAERLTED